MSDSIKFLEREIAQRKAEIEALQTALAVLAGKSRPGMQRTTPPAPTRKPAEKRGEGGILTVNGVDLELTAREFAVANAINDADDAMPAEQLDPLCGGKRNQVQQAVCSLNKKLKPAGANIVFFKGEGYRLQNMEEA